MPHRSITLSLLALVAWSLVLPSAAEAGRVFRDADGVTHIEIKCWYLPEPGKTDSASLATFASNRAFIDQFQDRFAHRIEEYKALAETDADLAQFDWDRVRISLVPFSALRVEGVETDLLAIAGGLQPDILYVNFRKSDNYIHSGFLYPLDKPEDGYWSSLSQDEIDFRVHPKIMPVIHRPGPGGNKQVWSMPYGGALGKVLLYRKDLFDQHHIPYPTRDWTWEQMLEACRKLTVPEENTVGTLLGGGKHASWYWITFLWSAGGDVMVYDEATDQWQVTFDSPEAAKALDFYVRLMTERWTDPTGVIQRGYAEVGGATTQVKWARGQVGMIFSYIDEKTFATFNPEVTGMVPVPLGPPDKNGIRTRGGELNSRMVGLFAGLAGGGHNKIIRDAAWEYIRWMTDDESVRIETRVQVESGNGAFINPKYLQRYGYEELIRLSPPEWSETFNIAIESGKPEPYGKNSNFAYNIMTEPIDVALQAALKDQLPEDEDKRLAILQGMLKVGNDKARRLMLGEITPKQRRGRNLAATALLAAIVLTFVVVLRKVARAFTPPPEPGQQPRGTWQFVKYRWAYLLLLPALLTIFVWQYAPLFLGSAMAFQDFQILRPSAWVGVANFGDLLWDADFWNSVWNAIRYTFLTVALTFLPPIILAILLQEVPHGKLFFRTLYYLPAVITGLVTILLWKQFYESSSEGMLNALLMKVPAIGFLFLGALLLWLALSFVRRTLHHRMFTGAALFLGGGLLLVLACIGLAAPALRPEAGEPMATTLAHFIPRLFDTMPEPYRWLQDPSKAMLACILPMVWAGMGPGCLIYLAALKGIPDDYYEAADMDGASFIDKLLFIVFPMLKALILINFIGVFIAAWMGGTANILAMTGGGANTEVVGLYIWYQAFTYLRMGPATAAAWLLGFMLIGFTVHQLRILSRLEFRTTGERE